jgi:hypothetical protein
VGERAGVRVRRLLVALAAAWVGRWALRELAMLVARRLPPSPPAIRSPRQPGRMPGPFENAGE